MNMDKFMPHWLNAAELRRIGGRYDGIVARVVVEKVHNRYKKEDDQKEEPVIEFTDGHRLVPNISMRRALMEKFGAETDTWTGARLGLECRRGVDRTDKKTGEVQEVWTKHLLFPDERPVSITEPAWTADTNAPDDSDPIGAHDEDDPRI